MERIIEKAATFVAEKQITMTLSQIMGYIMLPAFFAYLYAENLHIRFWRLPEDLCEFLLVAGAVMVGIALFNVDQRVKLKRRAKLAQKKAEAQLKLESARIAAEEQWIQQRADLFWDKNFSEVVSWADEVGRGW